MVAGLRRRMALTVSPMAAAPPSGRSSRATAVTTAWASPMWATASATRSGSAGSGRPGRAGRVDQAEAAGPGALVAVDHEGGGAVGPALEDVGAARLLAHRHQVEAAHGALDVAEAGAEVGLDPQPLRLALVDREPAGGTLAVHRGELRTGRRPMPRPPGATTRSTTSAMVTWTPSAAREVTSQPSMPQGTMRSNHDRSGSTLRAKPCMVRPRLRRTPMAHSLRRAVDPHARVAGEAAGAGQAEVGAHVDHQLLDAVDVGGRGAGRVGPGQDRVADELARPVVGDVAAPVGADQGRAEVVGVGEDVVERPPQAEGEDVRVLEEEQVGVGGPLEQRPLEGVGVGELRPPQPPGRSTPLSANW